MLTVELSSRAWRDLESFPRDQAEAILDDLQLLRSHPGPGPPKVKRLRGVPYFRLRTGDVRSIVTRAGQTVIVLRIVARKDLERVMKSL